MLFLNNPNSFVGKHKTTLLIILSILLFFALCFVIYKSASNSHKIQNEQLAARIDTIIQYKTLAGKTAYKIYEKQIVDKRISDSLARELKIKESEIEKYLTIISKADYSSIKASVHDTIYLDKDSVSHIGKYGEFKDPYIDVAALITDSLRFIRLNTIDTLTAVFQKTKIGSSVFNKLIVTNKSPYNKIVGLEDIKIKEEPQYRRWGLAMAAGWDPINKRPFAGFGVAYTIWRFRR